MSSVRTATNPLGVLSGTSVGYQIENEGLQALHSALGTATVYATGTTSRFS